jgi:cellulose synthase/poly-beta-1,6-N-acetylglucosamine synthase-like glycosyltransferase
VAELIFWISLAGIGYVYAGYPALLWLLVLIRRRPVHAADITPKVTVIVAAYNESAHIERKLSELLAQDYPREGLEIIVASDGSTDGTDDIVRRRESAGVKLVRVEGRLGKSAAQNAAVETAQGDILVFTDATTVIEKSAIRKLVRNFADESVGCVGGQLSYLSGKEDGVGAGGVRYWRYERALKTLESDLNSLIGVSGCFYGIRKNLYEPIAPNLISDFVIALVTYEKGYRVVYEPSAQVFEETLEDAKQEFAMRIRVALRTYDALWVMRSLLNPLRHGLYAIQLLSHKVLRYMVPLMLIAAFFSNLMLVFEFAYQVTLGIHLSLYVSGFLGFVLRQMGIKSRALSMAYYFILANVAAIVAYLKFLKGERIVTWTPVR